MKFQEVDRGPLTARVIHAVVVGAAGGVAFYLTHDVAIVVSTVIGAGVVMGEFIGRLPPAARRKRRLTPRTMEQLKKLQLAVNGDVHDIVNLLAALRGQLAFTVDALRRTLDELQAVEDSNPPEGSD